MQVEIKKLPGSEIEIIGGISADNFEVFRPRAVKEISDSIGIDGFRPGKAPEKILIEKVGEMAVLEKMANFALNKEYIKIIEENKIKAIGRPEITITKIAKSNPLEFKIRTAVLPEIELPDYKEIAGEIIGKEEEIIVEDSEVGKALDYLVKARAEKKENGEAVIPELNDEFAKSVGKFGSLEELKRVIKNNLKEEKTVNLAQKKRIEILDKIIESSKMDVPNILVVAEKNKMREEMKASITQMGVKWEDYLSHIKKTEEEIEKDWDQDALKRAKYNLAIEEIAVLEKIDVPEEELGPETDKLMEYYSARYKDIDRDRVKAYTYDMIKNQKVFNLLENKK